MLLFSFSGGSSLIRLVQMTDPFLVTATALFKSAANQTSTTPPIFSIPTVLYVSVSPKESPASVAIAHNRPSKWLINRLRPWFTKNTCYLSISSVSVQSEAVDDGLCFSFPFFFVHLKNSDLLARILCQNSNQLFWTHHDLIEHFHWSLIWHWWYIIWKAKPGSELMIPQHEISFNWIFPGRAAYQASPTSNSWCNHRLWQSQYA